MKLLKDDEWPPAIMLAFGVILSLGVMIEAAAEYFNNSQCKGYRVEWRESSIRRNMGTKQQQIVHVPAHWEDVCIEKGTKK